MTWRAVLSILTVLLVLPVATRHTTAAPRSPKLAEQQVSASAVGGAELALVPVGSSVPHVIIGNEITIPSGGATVELELRASSLQENGEVCIIGYGAQIDSAGYSSGIGGPLAPAQIPCNTNDDCFGEAGCEGDTCDARAAAFIDANRPDFLFAGLSGIILVDLSTSDYRFSVSMFSCRRGDSGYCGTLILDVPDDAAGTFTVGFHPDPETAVVDADFNFIPLTLMPALISITATECGNGIVELGEDCDGIDDAACPGVCLNDCTCASCGDGACDPLEDSCSCPLDCGTPPAGEVPLETCSDGVDNDCDGSIDAADTDCPSIPAVSAWGMVIMALLLLTLARVCRHERADRGLFR